MRGHAEDTDILAVRFKAENFSLSGDEYSSMAAFGDEPRQPKNYVLLQRIVNPSQEDIELGHDQVHIEINGQERSEYGAIETCLLQDEELRIMLNEDSAKRLRVASDIRIELPSDADQMDELSTFLAQLFTNGDQFRRQ